MASRPTVLLSDANVLIDYRDSDLSILTLVVQHVAPVHVLRDILDEVDGMSLSRCRETGLTVVDVEPEVLLTITALPRRLSRGDRLSFHVCRKNGVETGQHHARWRTTSVGSWSAQDKKDRPADARK